jgi:hypothetical protein
MLNNLVPYFKLANPRDVFRYQDLPGREVIDGPRDIEILQVYRSLKRVFGNPNGIVDYEKKLQWSYILKARKCTVEIHDWKVYSWNIVILPHADSEREGKEIAGKVAKRLLSSIRLAASRDKLPPDQYSHVFFANGYKDLFTNGDNLLRYYRKFSSKVDSYERELIKDFERRGIAFRRGWTKRLDARVKRRFILDPSALLWASATSFVLSSEALLTLVYDLYSRNEVVADNSLLQQTSSYSMKDKWIMAYLTCNCFKKPLSRESKGFQSLHRLSTLRNNLAHANISKEFRVHYFQEDGIDFVRQNVDSDHSSMPTPDNIELKDVERIRTDVDIVLQELVQYMVPENRKRFLRVLKWNGIIVSKSGGALRSEWV